MYIISLRDCAGFSLMSIAIIWGWGRDFEKIKQAVLEF
jgi:hypothetical protein